MLFTKRGNQQQCILETYDTCPAFVYVVFVWDMEHLGTTRMCPVKAIILADVWHYLYFNNTLRFTQKKKRKIRLFVHQKEM